jgi:hypothetical protein
MLPRLELLRVCGSDPSYNLGAFVADTSGNQLALAGDGLVAGSE